MYSVLNRLSEFYVSKNITSYTFLLVFKIVESLQCILNLTKIKTIEQYLFIVNNKNLEQYPWTLLLVLKRYLLIGRVYANIAEISSRDYYLWPKSIYHSININTFCFNRKYSNLQKKNVEAETTNPSFSTNIFSGFQVRVLPKIQK